VRSILFVGALVILASTGGSMRAAADDAAIQPAFEKFKALAGEWVSNVDGSDVTVTYKVTSGGSAVIETSGPGTPMEMVTMIHPDGSELVLTHYCMLGNQPQMRAPISGEGNKVAFKFTHATNLKSANAPHMHDVTYTFVDKNTLKAEWTMYQDGKPAGSHAFELKRK
jgi:hypothetical protein